MTALPFPLAEAPDEQTRTGRLLFARGADFLKGVVAMDGMPPADRAEVCFAGRSNVGKSTLINALTGRKALARASNTPGRTQEINFFTLGESHYLVDLPGYGYAEAPVAVVQKWQALLKAYLAGRATLRRAFVLIDARHGIKPVDEEIMTLLDTAAVTFQVVLTKADKVKAKDRDRVLAQVRKRLATHPAAFPELVLTSSETGDGIPPCAPSSPARLIRRPSSFPKYAIGRFTPAPRSPIGSDQPGCVDEETDHDPRLHRHRPHPERGAPLPAAVQRGDRRHQVRRQRHGRRRGDGELRPRYRPAAPGGREPGRGPWRRPDDQRDADRLGITSTS
jgi:GTP-binding protein